MWALFGTPEGITALVIGRFLYRLKKVFNIDRHTRAFPVSSSMSAPATGIDGSWLAKLTSVLTEPTPVFRTPSGARAYRPTKNTMAKQMVKMMRGTRDMHHCCQGQS